MLLSSPRSGSGSPFVSLWLVSALIGPLSGLGPRGLGLVLRSRVGGRMAPSLSFSWATCFRALVPYTDRVSIVVMSVMVIWLQAPRTSCI